MDNFPELLLKNNGERQILKEAEKRLRNEYIGLAAAFLKSWFETRAKGIVTEQPDRTSQFSSEDLKKLKAEVKNLGERSLVIANECFESCKYWHDFDDNDRRGLNYSFLNDALRAGAAYIAPIFAKRGFRVDVDTRHSPPTIGGTLGEDDKMAAVRKNYEANFAEYIRNRNERQNIENKQKEANAAQKWDEA